MAKKPSYDYDLIVIGSGAGGSPAASLAAREGLRVAIIEAGKFGGDSPNWSDIPSKSLLHAAHLYDEAKHGARFGIRSSMVGYNYPSIHAWKELAVKRTGAGGNRKFYENQGIATFEGTAHFLSPNEITVNRRHLSAERFLIATGSEWITPNIPGIKSVPTLTPRTILESLRPPKTLFIIGGDSVAVEIAQLMAIFGTKVYVAEPSSRLLPHEDEEVGVLMERLLREQKGITTLTQTRILSITKEGISKKVTYSRGDVEKSVRVDEILVATGRSPIVDLGLENASVKYTPRGIDVNDHLQTSARHIYAAGDVLGRNSSTHTALIESRIAISNMLRGKNPASPDYSAVPRVTFTFPEIASVGLSEDDCLKRDLHIKKAVTPLNIIARSNTSDYRDGFVKLIADQKGTLLGATIVAPTAAEMIHELALAIQHHMTAADVATAPHAFLTWSEAIRVAASKLA